MKIFVDIDETICKYEDVREYPLAIPIQENIDKINKLTKQVKNLGKIAETQQIWPGGIPQPDSPSNSIGGKVVNICNSVLKTLEDNKRGIKSNFIKIK